MKKILSAIIVIIIFTSYVNANDPVNQKNAALEQTSLKTKLINKAINVKNWITAHKKIVLTVGIGLTATIIATTLLLHNKISSPKFIDPKFDNLLKNATDCAINNHKHCLNEDGSIMSMLGGMLPRNMKCSYKELDRLSNTWDSCFDNVYEYVKNIRYNYPFWTDELSEKNAFFLNEIYKARSPIYNFWEKYRISSWY